MHVHDELLVLAQRFAAQQQPAAALKCLVAVLGSGPLPAVQARAGLLQARLLLEHSTNLGDARSILNTLVRSHGASRFVAGTVTQEAAICRARPLNDHLKHR